MDKQIPKLPTLNFEWNWIKDKRIIFDKVPYTHNWHLMVFDEDDELKGLWLIEAVYER